MTTQLTVKYQISLQFSLQKKSFGEFSLNGDITQRLSEVEGNENLWKMFAWALLLSTCTQQLYSFKNRLYSLTYAKPLIFFTLKM